MDFTLPQLGEGVYEAELVRWLVKPGAVVKRGQGLMEMLTDKATMEIPAPFAGTILTVQPEEGQTVKVGDVVLTYSEAASTETVTTPSSSTETVVGANNQSPPREAPTRSRNGSRVSRVPAKAAPSVRLMARKLGIDLGTVSGSGPDGRILIEDLSHVLQQTPASPASSPGTLEPKPDYGTPGTRIKLQGLRRKIAERMVQSKHTIPHYTYVDECDMTEVVRLRTGLRAAEQVGVKVTYLAFVVKAVAAALQEVPLINATLDEAAGEIVLHDRYDIGIATATPGGLIVPVLREAHKKDLFQVAREIERLSAEARAGRSRLEDLRGGTFTITSIGNIGGLFATPIINPPEVGILGVGKIVKRPVFDAAGQVKPADMVYLSLSFDHRVLDGAVGAAFGNAVIRRLQNPVALIVPSV